MIIRIEKSFDRDIDGINDKKTLKKLQEIITLIENARSIHDIVQAKKMKGRASYYRIRIGDYRLGLEIAADGAVVLLRFLHRKEIYRYFPSR